MTTRRPRKKAPTRAALPEITLICNKCSAAFTTKARGGQTIRCKECGAAKKVPRSRPHHQIGIQELPDQPQTITQTPKRRRGDTAPLTPEQIQRQTDKETRQSLRTQGLTDHQVRGEMQRRRDEQPTPTILDIAQQTAALLNLPTIAPPRRAPTPMRQPTPTQQPAPARPTICQANTCGSPVTAVISQTSGKRKTVHVCSVHITDAADLLRRDGVPVRGDSIANMKPRPPQCVAQGCNYPASNIVVQMHPHSQGTTGVTLTVCVAHIDAARTKLGTCHINTVPNAPVPISA